MIGGLERFLVVFAAAVTTYLISYAIYRKPSAAFWGYSAVWLTEFPIFILFLTGANSFAGFDIFIHTLAVPIFAVLLMIADILLIELALMGFLKPVRSFLLRKFSMVVGLYDFIKELQKYHAVPEPERVQTVFLVAVLGGLVNFITLFAAGVFV